MSRASSGSTPYIHLVSLIERFDAVLYPVDMLALLDHLPELGWVVRRRMTEEGSLNLRGAPTKGNTHLRSDPGNKTLGVAGNDLAEVLTTFRELKGLVETLFEFPPEVTTDYLEFRYVGWIRRESNPTEVFSSWWDGNQRVSQLGDFLQARLPNDASTLSPYGIKFAPARLEPNRPRWTELSITPQNIAGNHRYYFDLLFRHEDRTVCEGVAESADQLLDTTINMLETPDGH